MKVGDLVKLQNLHSDWGSIGLITDIIISENSYTGTINLCTASLGDCSIPWHKSDVYIKEVISESR